MKLSSVVYQTRNDSKWHSWQSDHQFAPSFGCPILRKLSCSFRGFAPDSLTRGSAPGLRWGLHSQTPGIGSRSTLAMVSWAPPLFFPSLRLWLYMVELVYCSIHFFEFSMHRGTRGYPLKLFYSVPRVNVRVHCFPIRVISLLNRTLMCGGTFSTAVNEWLRQIEDFSATGCFRLL